MRLATISQLMNFSNYLGNDLAPLTLKKVLCTHWRMTLLLINPLSDSTPYSQCCFRRSGTPSHLWSAQSVGVGDRAKSMAVGRAGLQWDGFG